MRRAPKLGINLPDVMSDAARKVDAALESILPAPHGHHGRIHEAMRYAVFAGGKRLRPACPISRHTCDLPYVSKTAGDRFRTSSPP